MAKGLTSRQAESHIESIEESHNIHASLRNVVAHLIAEQFTISFVD